MSKLYKRYLECKKQNDQLYYLFPCGIFYLFLDEDARYISNILSLKCTNLNDTLVKCGFPKNSLTKYLTYFEKNNIPVVIVSNDNKTNNISLKDVVLDDFVKELRDLDLEKTTPMQVYLWLKEVKEKLYHE